MNQSFAKILILSRGVWDESVGTSSTLTNYADGNNGF